MDIQSVPIGFGLALSANTAAMNRYAHLTESQKQDILNKAHSVRSEKEMYSLVRFDLSRVDSANNSAEPVKHPRYYLAFL